MVYCYDCGAKLHFCAAKSLNKNQEFFRCANYKDGRGGTCKIHYIRNIVLEKILLEAIRNLAEFIRYNEKVFLYLIAKQNDAMRKVEYEKLKKTVADGEIRIKELDRLIEKVYEDNALGRIDDDRYRKLMAKYEREQKELTITVSKGQETLKSAEQKSVDLRLLLRTFREMTDIQELTPTLVNSLIERIEVHNNDKSSGHCFVKVDIYFTGVGMICIPIEEEVIAMMEEARKKPQEYRIVA